jgi:hypothetical protein
MEGGQGSSASGPSEQSQEKTQPFDFKVEGLSDSVRDCFFAGVEAYLRYLIVSGYVRERNYEDVSGWCVASQTI